MTSSYYPIHEKLNFNVNAYAETLDKAIRAGDKKTVAKLIVGINNEQRQKLKQPYYRHYGKDLDVALKTVFSGDALNLMQALMKTPLQYDLDQLEYSMKGAGTCENTLIEIICSRTPYQLKIIAEHYDKNPKHANSSLAKTIADDTSGEFRDLLLKLVKGSKDDGHAVNDAKAHDDAVRLFADGKGKFKGKDGSHFLNILATQNTYQLRKVFAEFEKLSGQTIDNAIKKEFSGDLEDAYQAIVLAISNKQKFFARQLYRSMVGLGTRDNDLIRAIVTRSEIDLNLIKEEFKLMYQTKTQTKTLEDFIRGDTSGIYCNTLLDICAGNQ